jgi:hypothetical protein
MAQNSGTIREAAPLSAMRRFLLWTLAFGAAGMMTELLLIGHDESASQLVPLLLLASGVVMAVVVFAVPRPSTLRVLQALMGAFLVSGVIGVGLHYHGNEEFELEMYPALTGLELVSKTFTGATPVLAPGSMSLLGIVGLVFTYRHPLLTGGRRPVLSEEDHS